MLSQDSPIPRISISPPPPQDPAFEPFSPFNSLEAPIYDEDGFRPIHLTPPPTSTHFKGPVESTRKNKVVPDDAACRGLESERFLALLKATRERTVTAETKKNPNLRKELALKVHKNKQAERRALFLSKVQAPPSPSAADSPKTPPDSPAVFHYSLPSPGLVSPLALFETLDRNRDGWVEQVDFRLTGMEEKKLAHGKPKPKLPSLDQISARLIPRTVKPGDYFAVDETPTTVYTARPSIGVGRLRMPLRTSPMNLQLETQPAQPKQRSAVAPQQIPELRVTTLVVPRTSNTSPTKLTENNLIALNSRGQRAHNMLSTLRRRTSSLEIKFPGKQLLGADMEDEYKWRRNSAPPDMNMRARFGFDHPVLGLPGGF